MKYNIELSKRAVKKLKSLERRFQKQIAIKIEKLVTNPLPKDSKKIQGDTNLYRLRSGNYRILYRIFDKKILILIFDIGHRKEIYKDMR